VSEDERVPASARYKEIAECATDAAKRMRRHEVEKASRLQEEVAAGHERIAEAEAQQEQVVDGVQRRWKAAMEALWDERWMQVTRIPDADPSAAPATPQESIRAVQAASLELHEALRKSRSWLRKPRRNRRDTGDTPPPP
jgi:hypothetical protein